MSSLIISLESKFINNSFLATAQGRGIQILFSSLLIIAVSKCHGWLVAAINSTCFDISSDVWTSPSTALRSSVNTLLLQSLVSSVLLTARESISSKKIIDGAQNLAISNKSLTSFSLSPLQRDPSEAAVILKNLESQELATAFASIVFPVPGGPNNSIPFQGLLNSVLNNCGQRIG